MTEEDIESLVRPLTFAASERTISSTTSEPWQYGWCVESYRRSPKAAIQHDRDVSVGLSARGVRAYEGAVRGILQHPEVKKRWDADELWGVVIAAVGEAPLSDGPKIRSVIEAGLRNILLPVESVVAFPVANVRWTGSPQALGSIVLGPVSDEWRQLAGSSLSEDMAADEGHRPLWLGNDASSSVSTQIIAVAVRVSARGSKAETLAEQTFDDLVDLALLFEADLEKHELYSGRGDANRPGIRGVRLHRPVLEEWTRQLPQEATEELAAPIVKWELGKMRVTHHWLSADPVPLDALLANASPTVERALWTETVPYERLRTTARWHARAHWAITAEEALLSLGIAFDALLGSEGASQRREISERFALVHPVQSEREDRYSLFSKTYYSARSAVAHGRQHEALLEPGFNRKMSRHVRTTALCVATLIEEWGVDNETKFADMFAALKWGRDLASS